MDELYLDNIDEFVNDHDKIVSTRLSRDVSPSYNNGGVWTAALLSLAVELRLEKWGFTVCWIGTSASISYDFGWAFT